VESTQFMRFGHVDLLNNWKDAVVREGRRTYISSTGNSYTMSLTNTCITQCHFKKSAFCDRCHDYMSVKPWCWDCHNFPREAGQ
jgi:hypothetical protein